MDLKNKKLLLQDKESIMQLLGGIMRDPSILSNTKEYPIELDDFPEPFHKTIYGAMENLYKQGGGKAEFIYPEEILALISKTTHRNRFLSAEGDKYLTRLAKLRDNGNFDYHFKRLRKFSLLRHATSLGFDMTDIYDPEELDINKIEERNKKFDEMTIEQITGHLDRKMNQLHAIYTKDSSGDMDGHMGKNIDTILENMLEGLAYGTHLISKATNAITFGLNDSRLYCVSAPTGHGKSRIDLQIATEAAVEKYDRQLKKWVYRTPSRRVLYLGTELTEEQVKAPLIAHIAGVDEHSIKQGRKFLTDDELERLQHATDVIKRSPFWFVHLGNFDLQDIEFEINKHIVTHGVDIVVFDYIHTSLKLFTSLHNMGARNLREDQILYQLVTRIKDFTTKYNIPIFTNTQVNDKYKEGIWDENTLQGAKAIGQKLDFGAIMAELQPADKKFLEELKVSNPEIFGIGFVEPNVTLNWYKTRDGRYARTRQWAYFNRGTLEWRDCFFTNYYNELVTGIPEIDLTPTEEPVESNHYYVEKLEI